MVRTVRNRFARAIAVPLVAAVGMVAGYTQFADVITGDVARIVGNATADAFDTGIDPVRTATADRPTPTPVSAPVAAHPDAEIRRWVGHAVAALASVPVEPEFRRGYERSDWPHWSDEDGDCMDARHETLVAQSSRRVRTDRSGCRVVAGVWVDPYTAQVFTDPSDLDVDHVVPLQEAHDSGGHSWSRARREAFANDLAFGRSLMAVEAAANRSKGAKGPEEWLPPSRAHLCVYVADWTLVKHRWGLSMDERERVVVGNVLSSCSGSA